MSEEDKKLRSYWVKFLWAMTAFNMVTTAFFQLYFAVSKGDLPAAFRYGGVAFSMAGMLFFAYLLYRFAYKKRGTKFLTFCLIVTLFGFVGSPILYFQGRMPLADQIPYYKFYFLFTQALGVAWFVLCWKMRKINKKLRAQNP